jgi:hypothetical protein
MTASFALLESTQRMNQLGHPKIVKIARLESSGKTVEFSTSFVTI